MDPDEVACEHFLEFYNAFHANTGAAVGGKKAKSASHVTTPQWLAAFA